MAVQVGKYHNSQLILTTIKQALMKAGTAPKYFIPIKERNLWHDCVLNILEELGTHISASDKGCPWQNGFQESFFGRFKEEFW